jgi:long-chain acyl-CoA synthetase
MALCRCIFSGGSLGIVMTAEQLLQQQSGFIADVIREHARERPQQTALIDEARVLDYGALDRLVDRVAASLQRAGLRAGDVIAICATARVEYGAIFLGALRAGVAVAPLAPSSTSDALRAMLADSGAQILFLDATVGAALAATPLSEKLQRVSLDDSNVGEPMTTWLAPVGSRPAAARIDPAAAFNIIYSSGTTGTPKGIVQSHGMRWAHARRASAGGYDATA